PVVGGGGGGGPADRRPLRRGRGLLRLVLVRVELLLGGFEPGRARLRGGLRGALAHGGLRGGTRRRLVLLLVVLRVEGLQDLVEVLVVDDLDDPHPALAPGGTRRALLGRSLPGLSGLPGLLNLLGLLGLLGLRLGRDRLDLVDLGGLVPAGLGCHLGISSGWVSPCPGGTGSGGTPRAPSPS